MDVRRVYRQVVHSFVRNRNNTRGLLPLYVQSAGNRYALKYVEAFRRQLVQQERLLFIPLHFV